MRLSFDDEESFKEAVSSLHFNNPPSNPASLQRVGSSSNSMLPQEPERNEDSNIGFDNPSSDPNIILEVQRVPVGSISSTGSMPTQEKSENN